MNGIKTGLGITPGEHIISADSALSRNIRHCFCLSCKRQRSTVLTLIYW
ncbi:malate transporter [Escherichia coli]|nr:hypothetical protein A31I_03274 [Escherichia coli KTE162]MCT9570843.1 malate transporter [Escherichia coli]MCT9589955.1 malate transporter [Escherichia coli]MCT9594756.1 malate transporter [Escherichia coli]